MSGEEARGGAAPGNPTEIRDWRDPAEWPAGAKPATRKIAYDDLYRVRQIKYEYSAGDDTWVSPFAKENGESYLSTNFDFRRSLPASHISFDKRVLEQNIEYDWLGNTSMTDDDAHGFYDRSLGTVTNDTAHGKPYQLASANNASKGGNRTGHLETKYDVAGNLTDMALTRNPHSGPAIPGESGLRFQYKWDEVGRLVQATRWEVENPDVNDNIPWMAVPSADLTYIYDASDNRVVKSALIFDGMAVVDNRHSVYISGGQELRGARFGEAYLDPETTGTGDYELSANTEIAYLFAHGVRLGRVAYDKTNAMPEYSANGWYPLVPEQHVLINLDDTLGSTALVIDQATGELVESTAYLAHGATESDYRPDRWQGLREDYRFTGKEEDVEVGLQYFGKRFLSPYIGRWVSADPLAVHVPGKADWNLYAYVSGGVLKSVDPVGLCGDQDACIRGDFRTSDVPEVRAIGDSNHPPADDQDKAADTLGVSRQQIKNGLPTAEAIDHARQGLHSSLQQDTTLKPTGNGQGIQGWTTELGGTKRQYTPTGKEDGYAGEKPAVPVMSPIDLMGPAAARGIWMLGGRALRLAEAAPLSASAAEATAAKPFAMGLTDEGLDAFASARGATTWKQLPDPANWRSGVVEKLADPTTQVHFNLDGVDIWPGLSRAAAGRGGPTDWELLTIKQNPQFWDTIQFWKGDQPVANPFQ